MNIDKIDVSTWQKPKRKKLKEKDTMCINKVSMSTEQKIPQPTMTQLREKNPLFFSKSTMNFFGQTFHMFRLARSKAGNWYLYAPAYMVDSYTGEKTFMHYTFRRVRQDSKLVLPEGEYNKHDLDSILEYIERN